MKPVDRRLLHLHFFEQRTQQEIASELGITRSQVSCLLTPPPRPDVAVR